MSENTKTTTDLKKKLCALIGEVDSNEMACRILEASMGLKRPVGTTALQALSQVDDETRPGLYAAAAAACLYITEVINDGVRPQ